jgi:hypothetical protein
MRFAADYGFKAASKPYPSGRGDFIAICLTKFSYQSSNKILGSVAVGHLSPLRSLNVSDTTAVDLL